MSRLLLFSIFIYLLSGCTKTPEAIKHTIPSECDTYSLREASCLTQEALLKRLDPYSVIFIGDHHTQDDLHQRIASLITALSKEGITVHLANEWFTPEDAPVLDAYSAKDINETEFISQIEWNKRLRYLPYSSFKPMYEAVRSGGGRLHGINLSKRQRKAISDQNLSAMSPSEQLFNKELDLNVTAHKTLISPYIAHCHAPKADENLQECIDRMYRVQVAWDTQMAKEAVLLSTKLKPSEKLIVFAGALHMEDKLGIPLRFARHSVLPTMTIIPRPNTQTKADHGLGDILFLYTPSKTEE